MKNKRLLAGAILFFSLIILFSFSAGFSEVNMSNPLAPFSSEHPLGTDTFGRDLLERLSLGALISIALSVGITLISLFFGLILSFLMARGNVLSALTWVLSDSMKCLSSIVLALFLSSIFSPGFSIIVISISLAHIPNIARVGYSKLMSVKNEEYVLYAESEGMGEAEIAFRHLLPHLMPEIASQSLGVFSSSILTESSLSFLGVGIPILYPSIGAILSEGKAVMFTHPGMVILPSLLLFLISLSLHLIYSALDLDS